MWTARQLDVRHVTRTDRRSTVSTLPTSRVPITQPSSRTFHILICRSKAVDRIHCFKNDPHTSYGFRVTWATDERTNIVRCNVRVPQPMYFYYYYYYYHQDDSVLSSYSHHVHRGAVAKKKT
jgi:hypothetical protein